MLFAILVMREIFKRDFAVSGTIFAASDFLLPLIAGFPKVEAGLSKFWPGGRKFL